MDRCEEMVSMSEISPKRNLTLSEKSFNHITKIGQSKSHRSEISLNKFEAIVFADHACSQFNQINNKMARYFGYSARQVTRGAKGLLQLKVQVLSLQLINKMADMFDMKKPNFISSVVMNMFKEAPLDNTRTVLLAGVR